ncbi:hypothetical protein T4E_7311 [Trichinella pseudospiralis]|uniref:Uncharacterized protein n=1 Tax=Trichinella pseudospiralis TaxID=6337 RepID=A0A0V0YD39_TRIPS|nr:hypothetical protein T4E_7311 [Trichinella pseudospiralis]
MQWSADHIQVKDDHMYKCTALHTQTYTQINELFLMECICFVYQQILMLYSCTAMEQEISQR